MRGDKPPIAEGEEYSAFIDNVGVKGDGVLRVKGFVVFVPGVKKGDYIKVRITKVLPKVAFGTLVEKLEPPKRSLPEDNFKPFKKEPKPLSPEIEELLTTDGDSEEFGEDFSDDEEE